MKTIKPRLFSVLALLVVTTACNKDIRQDESTPQPVKQPAAIAEMADNSGTSKKNTPSGPCNSAAYTITLESRTQVDGNWEWVWSVQNPNPGNGSNGTSQNLSHWGMQFGACVALPSIVSAAYSGDGVTWTSFVPVYQSDPSQGCMTTPVLKFDYGTTSNAKSYYKIVFSSAYDVVSSPGYYKSGANTGCCTFSFAGVGCEGDDGDIR